MSVIGIRVSSKKIRYAIVEKLENGILILENKNNENELKFPVDVIEIEEKLLWLKNEISSIINNNPNIKSIVVKTNEYTRTESKSKRENTYFDAIIIVAAKELNKNAVMKLYNQLDAKSDTVMSRSEKLVDKTERCWDKTMADAVIAAYWGINNV